MRSETRDRRRVSRSLGRPTPRPARFRVLGPLEVSGEGGALPLGGPKQRTALAHLILNANQVVAAEQLIDALWGEEPPDAARGTLQAYISRLRSVLGIEHDRGPSSRVRAPCRTRRGRCASLRTAPARRAPIRRRATGRRRDARRGARPVARAGAGGPGDRAVPRARDRPVGGAQAPGHRGGDRVRSSTSAGRLMPSRSSRRSRVSTRCASGCGAS